ncbi:MAG: MinD/ParA family protein [Nitrospinota bacterium]
MEMTKRYGLDKEVKANRMFTVTVASGKGGVGKSTISLNLAIALAQRKRRVILLDGDLGLGNINVMLGIRPEKDLANVIDGDCSIEEAIMKGPWGISILPAGSGYEDMADLGEEGRGRLLSALRALSKYADALVIDSGAGIGANVLNLALAADIILVVITPDVVSLTDAYSLVKVISRRSEGGRFEAVVNRAHTVKAGEEITAKFRSVAKKFLNREITRLGIIPEDGNVQAALMDRKPLLQAFPKSPASMEIRSIADLLTKEIRQIELEFHAPNLDERFEKIIAKL